MKLILLCFVLALPSAAQTSIASKLYAPPAASRPPAKLFVGPVTFEVGMLEPQYMAGNDGATICDKRLIIVNVATSEIRMRQVFMHEALHAIFCVYEPTKVHWWSRPETRRHRDIYVLGPALAALMADNAYLDKWLKDTP